MLNQEGWNLCFFIKVDISEIYISFVFFCETKEKTNNICISNTSTFLNVIF